MRRVKLVCTFEEMRAIVRALQNYKYDLANKSDSVPANWFEQDDEYSVADIMVKLSWENSDWLEE